MKRILLLLSAFALAACVNEKYDMEEQGGERFAFTAGFSDDTGPETRVVLDHYQQRLLYVLWEKGDKVSVYDGRNKAQFVSDRAGLSSTLLLDEGQTCNEQAEKYYALYPYDEEAVFSEGYVETSLPAVQYARRDAFSAHRAVATATKDDKNFVFQNVTAVFKAIITSDVVKKLVFTGNDGETVAGNIKISYADATYKISGNASTSVTVLPQDDAQFFTPGVYYFTVLPQTFSNGFTITIHLEDESTEARVVSGNTIIPRSSLSEGKPIGTEGEGTELSPYLIKNKYDLEGLSTIVADDDIKCDQTTYIRIINDIDLQGIENWRPINNIRDPKYISKLHIDGQKSNTESYTISGFGASSFTPGMVVKMVDSKENVVTDASKSQPSLFGILRGTVQNLNIVGTSLELGSTSTVSVLAGLIGYPTLNETVTVQNVHISNSTLKGKKVVSGFAGMAYNAEIINCSSTNVAIEASGEHASGLIARFDGNLTLNNCHVSGSVEGTTGLGGLVGYNEDDDGTSNGTLSITGSSSRCAIAGNYQVGGLVGYTALNTDITSSYVLANITGEAMKRSGSFFSGKQVGGILGVADTGVELDVQKCYYKGTISADGSFVGGIVGYSKGITTITNCHANCTSITNTGAYNKNHSSTNYDLIGVGGILGGHSSTGNLSITCCFVDQGTITSKANGTVTTTNMPATWDAWVDAVKTPNRKNYYLGGGVGGILGYSGSTNTEVNKNISWITSLTCTRTNILDASCGPIVGCLPQDNDKSVANNRYYNSPDGLTHFEFSDTHTGYVPRALNLDKEDRTKVISALIPGEGESARLNQYCVYNKEAANNGIGGQKNAPSNVAKDGNWNWDTAIWNVDNYKPFLKVHAAVYNSQQ